MLAVYHTDNHNLQVQGAVALRISPLSPFSLSPHIKFLKGNLPPQTYGSSDDQKTFHFSYLDFH